MYKKIDVDLGEVRDIFDNGGVVFTTASDRGVGKSRLLMQYAKENDLTVLVRNRHAEKYLRKFEEYKDVKICHLNENLRGVRSNNEERIHTLLMDDIKKDAYNELKDILGFELVGFVEESS